MACYVCGGDDFKRECPQWYYNRRRYDRRQLEEGRTQPLGGLHSWLTVPTLKTPGEGEKYCYILGQTVANRLSLRNVYVDQTMYTRLVDEFARGLRERALIERQGHAADHYRARSSSDTA